MARINIPTNPDDLIALAQGILAKHKADGNSSPLAALDIADMTAKTATADAQNQSAAKLYRDAETATQTRDVALGSGSAAKGSVAYYVRSARDILLGINKGNEQKLGDWSFEVAQSTKSGSSAKPAPQATTTK